jgi:hypothetical protein
VLIHAESVWPMSAASVISKEVGTSSLLGGPNSKPNGWLRRALAHDELPVEPWIPSNERKRDHIETTCQNVPGIPVHTKERPPKHEDYSKTHVMSHVMTMHAHGSWRL